MRYRSWITLAFAVPAIVGSASAQPVTPTFDVASLRLAVSELRTTDSIISRQGVFHPSPGRRFVVATLRGEAATGGRFISTPTLFAAQIEQRLIPARAFSFSTSGGTRPNWVVRPDGDPTDAPSLYVIVRPGPVQVQVLFDVPVNVTTLQVALPTRASGVTAIGTP